MTMRLAAIVMFALGGCAVASAQQNITGLESLQWQQDTPDLFAARSYRYLLVVDQAAPVELAGVTCTGTTTPFTCRAPLPALRPWLHTLSLMAAEVTGPERRTSQPSRPLEVFVMIQPIRAPKGSTDGLPTNRR
jgi:hypothetical protein